MPTGPDTKPLSEKEAWALVGQVNEWDQSPAGQQLIGMASAAVGTLRRIASAQNPEQTPTPPATEK
jgi:hypothetical protein